jgi:hypothetical protein
VRAGGLTQAANPWNCVMPLRKIGMNNILAPVPKENIRKP